MKILITGTSRGIGLMLTEELINSGHEIMGVSRSDFSIANKNYKHFKADLANITELEKVLDQIEQVDVLINCAGIASMNPFILSEMKEFEKIIGTNVLAPYFLSREVSKKMIAKGFGRILNISTIATTLNLKGEIQYIMSKASLEKLTVVASKELAPFGITVNTIGVSLVKTNLLSGVTEEQLQKIKSQLSFSEYVEKEDLAHVVKFFISENARYITGQIINFGGV